jgi:hypothetical protein
MIENSAPLPWVEAQDQPRKSAEENRKRAKTSLLSDFQPQKTQDSNTMTTRNTSVIYFRKNRPAQNSQRPHTRENGTSSPAFDKKTPVKSNQRETRASARQGGLAAACRTNSRRRKAKGLAPNLCNKEHMKSLTGQTTYAIKKHINTYKKPPFKSPTCLALTALLCTATLFASLFGTTTSRSHTYVPLDANKFQTAALTDRVEQRSLTEGHTTGGKNGARGPETKPEDLTHNQRDNRYIDTAEGRETALPYCKYANKDETQKRAQAQNHTG